MNYEPLKWDVRTHPTPEDLRLKLVKEILNRMTDDQLRSAIHQYIYLQFQGCSSADLHLEAATRNITL